MNGKLIYTSNYFPLTCHTCTVNEDGTHEPVVNERHSRHAKHTEG